MTDRGRGRKKAIPKPVVPAQRETRSQAPRMASVVSAHNSATRVCWRFNLLDPAGPWTIKPEDWPEVIGHLTALESMTMNQLFGTGNVPGKVYDLSDEQLPTKDARDRWQAMDLDDQDHVCRLGHGGTIRIYGLRVDNVFHVIWWDPKHEIWPSKKK